MEGATTEENFLPPLEQSGFGILNTIEEDNADFLYGDVKPITKTKAVVKEEPKTEEKKKEEEAATSFDPLEGEEEVKEKPSDKKPEETPEDTDNKFEALAKELFDLGIFTPDEEEEIAFETGEAIAERFQKEKQKGISNGIYGYLQAKHGEEGIEVFNAIFRDGVAPQDYLTKYVALEDVSSLDMTQESNQESVMRIQLKEQGWPQDKIDLKIERLKNNVELEEEAVMAHKAIVSRRQQALTDAQEKAQREQNVKVQKETENFNNLRNVLVSKLKEKNIDGLPLTDKKAQQVLQWGTKKQYTYKGEEITEWDKFIMIDINKPENAELKSKFMLLAIEGGDLSKVKAAALSTTKDTLFNKVVQLDKGKQRSTLAPSQKPLGEFL